MSKELLFCWDDKDRFWSWWCRRNHRERFLWAS